MAHETPPRPLPSIPYGSWPSPISAAQLAGATIRLGMTALRGADLFWSEGRPHEQGRNVVMQRDAHGALHEWNAAPFDARTRVHEYGGGAYALLDTGGLVFSHDGDQQVYRLDSPGAAPRRITDTPGRRYADLRHDAARDRLIAVCEDHRDAAAEARASLVAIDLASGAVQELVAGSTFYSSPALSPDGRALAWLSWDHPDMPWDATTLWLADIDADGMPSNARRVAGGDGVSIFQPSWSPDGRLHAVSDRSGWWNLHELRGDTLVPLHPMQAEFGVAQWAFGMSTYGFDARAGIVCTYTRDGAWSLATLDADGLHPHDTPFCSIRELHVADGFATFIGAGPRLPEAVIRYELASGRWEAVRRVSQTEPDPGCTSVAEAIEFPTSGGLTSHAFFYPPTHDAVRAPDGERPPLLVITHGGPTGANDAAFKWALQYWTSRGFAIVDVNYGGSTGYGRAYRERLNGRWGIVDVDDAVAAARFLVERGDVDPARLAIRGASAGGYTTLAALTFRDYFKAGASHYGIGDLEALARDTHKFESRYLDRLVGPYPAERERYRERSPVLHTDRLRSPMILLQGLQDKAVPPSQAQAMHDAVSAKGLPVALLMFDGEQHGFRRSETIRRALEAELYFYGRVFGFVPADTIQPVPIDNLQD